MFNERALVLLKIRKISCLIHFIYLKIISILRYVNADEEKNLIGEFLLKEFQLKLI